MLPALESSTKKDDHKIKAFCQMASIARNLSINEVVCIKARVMFAALRDAKDRVMDFDSTLAACLIAGHYEVLEQELGVDGPQRFDCPCKAVFTCKLEQDRHKAEASYDRVSEALE